MSWSFPSRSFILSSLMFRSLIHFELLSIWFEIRVHLPAFACEYPVFQISFVEIIFPLLCSLGTLDRDHLTIYVSIHFWAVSTLSHCSVCLSLCQYHPVLIIVLSNIFWDQEVWGLQLCSSFSRLFWLLWVLWDFLWILGFFSISTKNATEIFNRALNL